MLCWILGISLKQNVDIRRAIVVANNNITHVRRAAMVWAHEKHGGVHLQQIHQGRRGQRCQQKMWIDVVNEDLKKLKLADSDMED